MKIKVARPPSPPDGGWGWVIVAAAFIINFLLSGDTNSFPVLLPELSSYFDVNESFVSWAGYIRFGACFVSGPLVGYLVNKYGCKEVTLLGAVIVFVSGCTAARANDVMSFIFLFGVVQGIAHGLSFIPPIIAIGTFFEKRRAIAIGIASSGGGLGGMLLPPLLRFLIDEFTWRGAILLTSAMMLNIIGGAMLFRKLEEIQTKEDTPPIAIKLDTEVQGNLSQLLNETDCDGSLTLVTSANSLSSFMESDIVSPRKESVISIKLTPSFLGLPATHRSSSNSKTQDISASLQTTLNETRSESPLPLPVITEDPVDSDSDKESKTTPNVSNDHLHVTDLRVMTLRRQSRLSQISSRSAQNKKRSQRNSIISYSRFFDGLEPEPKGGINWRMLKLPFDKRKLNSRRQTAACGDDLREFYLIENKRPRNSRWMQIDDDEERRFSLHSVPTRVSFSWLEKTGRQPDPDILLKFNPPSTITSSSESSPKLFRPLDRKDVLYGNSIADLDHFESKRSGIACPRPTLIQMAEASAADVDDNLEFKRPLWKSPSLWMHLFVNALFSFSYCIPLTYLISLAQELDITVSKAKYLLSIIGVVNCVGRLGIGLASDLLHIRGLYLTAIGMVISGVSTMVILFLPAGFTPLSLYTATFAFGLATYTTLQSIVVVELFGLERLTDCFGILQLFSGVAAILGPPFGGLVAEKSGNYFLSFLIAGATMTVSGVLQWTTFLVASQEGTLRTTERKNPIANADMIKLNDMLAQPKEQLI